MLIKYKYTYDEDDGEPSFSWSRLEKYKQPNPRDEYGIVFGKIIDKKFDVDDTYDIPLELIVACMRGGSVPEFQTSIPTSDTELVVDLVSQDWITLSCIHHKDTFEYTYSKEPGDVMVSAFPEFFDNGFWFRANDLNLDYNENPAEGEMMRRYVCEYGKIYLNYIAEHRQDFPGIDESWLKLGGG